MLTTLFNCHGTEGGIVFANEETKHIDQISKDIYDIRRQLRDPDTLIDIPVRVRLVFAQCWSNLATPSESVINGFLNSYPSIRDRCQNYKYIVAGYDKQSSNRA